MLSREGEEIKVSEDMGKETNKTMYFGNNDRKCAGVITGLNLKVVWENGYNVDK